MWQGIKHLSDPNSDGTTSGIAHVRFYFCIRHYYHHQYYVLLLTSVLAEPRPLRKTGPFFTSYMYMTGCFSMDTSALRRNSKRKLLNVLGESTYAQDRVEMAPQTQTRAVAAGGPAIHHGLHVPPCTSCKFHSLFPHPRHALFLVNKILEYRCSLVRLLGRD